MKNNNWGKPIFTIAWDFPPIVSGESTVCYRMLSNSSFKYDVCCGKANLDVETESITSPNITSYALGGKYLIWPFRVLSKFLKLDKTKKYSVFQSRVMPPNGHLAGLLIKLARPSIKWIVYFSDPIWNSPFLKITLKRNKKNEPNYLLMKIFGVFSKMAIVAGDLLVFNNERLAQYVLGSKYEKYKHKTVIAPYGFEYVETKEESILGDRIMIAHVGQIYGNRTLKEVVDALEQLKINETTLYNTMQICLVGFVCQSEIQRIEKSNVADRFSIIGAVDYATSIEYMKSADYLLIIDPVFKDCRQNVYVPVKIFDYMSVRKPIIAIADRNSATNDIIKSFDGLRASHNSSEVYELLCGLRVENRRRLNPNMYDNFECSKGVLRFDTALREML